MKILVADDHALIREALRYVLQHLDEQMEMIEAPDGAAALHAAAETPDLDLALLDLGLPGIGGFETLSRLRRAHPLVPVVILSGIEDPQSVAEALHRGAAGFIPKSSANEVMLNALRLVLSGGCYLPPQLLNEIGVPPARMSDATTDPCLTDRQRQVLTLMAQGKSNKLICRELGLAESTVKIHVSAILKTLGVTSRTQAVIAAQRLGLVAGIVAGQTSSA